MKVAVLTGGFPSQDNPSKSIFNLRAVVGLLQYVDVTVFHFRYWKPGRKLITNRVFNKVEVVEVSLPWLPVNSPFLNALNVVLWKVLVVKILKNRLEKFDSLHSIGLEITLTVSILAKKLNKKHVAQAIGSDLLIYLPQKERFFNLEKWIDNTNVVVCNSNYLKKKLLKRYPRLEAKVLYRGTNLEQFNGRGLLNSGVKTIVYLGGFSNRIGSGMGSDLKGGETLKSIWKHFDAIDSLNVKIKLGGPLSDADNQLDWKAKLKHPERVDLLGILHPDDVPSLLNNAHIVLIPSKSEGLPNVAVEACGAGALVIASNVGGIPEVVINNKNGFLLEPNDKDLWIKTIEKVLNNFNEYEQLRENAVEFIRDNFDADSYPKNLIKVYKSM